jgi:predicted permease
MDPALNGMDQIREEQKGARGLRFVESVRRDLWYAARQLRRSPAFAAAAVISLGLAIGANAAMFSIVDAVLLRPLPYPQAERLVRLDGVFARLGLRVTETGVELIQPLTAPELLQARSFASIGLYSVSGVNLGNEGPARLRAAAVTPGFFTALAVRPAIGRTFTDDDLKQTDRVAVISFRMWRQRFLADPLVVGRTVDLNGHLFSVVGVMPADVDVPDACDIWIPQRSDAQVSTEVALPAFIARLAPNVTASSARAEVLRLIQDEPLTRRDAQSLPLTVTPLRDALTADVRPILVLVGAAALLVLIVACLNTTNLLLARVSAREREFTVRRALGASTWELVRQVACESLLLAALAGVVAIPIAFVTLGAVRPFIPMTLHGAQLIAIDLRTFAGLTVLCLLAAGLFGLAPAISAQGRAATTLRATASTTEDTLWRRFRSCLVTVEIAVAVAILIGATTMVRTVGDLMTVDLGARNDRALVMEVTLPRATYASTDRIRQFYEQLRGELLAVPGVEAVGATSCLPGTMGLTGASLVQSAPMMLEGEALPGPSATRNALHLLATPGYFSALGIDVLVGRAFDDRDRAGSTLTTIVSEGFVRAFGLTAREVLGRRVNVNLTMTPRWAEVIGVVSDVRMQGPETDVQPAVYVPFAQTSIDATGFVVVKATLVQGLVPSIRSAVGRVDASLPLYNVRTFGEVRSEYLAPRRFAMTTMVSFGSVAFGLAALGLYGVISYLVRLRTREIGIRIAIGAPPALVRRQVIGSGALHAVAGIAIGLVSSLGLWRIVSAHVHGVGHLDWAGSGVLCAAVFCVSTSAAWLPARRAAHTDPLVALRSE